MLKRLYHAWLQHGMRHARIPYVLWRDYIAQIPVLAILNAQEQRRLRDLASLFLHEKTFSGAGGLEINDRIRITIGAQACLLVLNLDLDLFKGWREIIVYPDSFVVTREERDETGLIHNSRRTLGGEAWSHGPVILSWPDAQLGARPHGLASNVIVHEFAHKLDMLNGSANGMPPLHANMVRKRWTDALSSAFDNLHHQLEWHYPTAIDPYAAQSPAEFFAVCTEVFFEQPARLQQLYPDVYQQLSLFYRQDPVRRLA